MLRRGQADDSQDFLAGVQVRGQPAELTVLFGKWGKDKPLANALLGGLHPALGIPRRDPYSLASGVLLKSEMPAASPKPSSSPARRKDGSSPTVLAFASSR